MTDLKARDYGWVITARWLVVGGFGLFGVICIIWRFVEPFWPLIAISSVVALINAMLKITAWHDVHPGSGRIVSFLFDTFALTAYLHFSGDIENGLRFAYSLPIAAAALTVSKSAAFLVAGWTTLLWFLLVAGTYWDAFPIHFPHHHLSYFDPAFDRIVAPDVNEHGAHYLLSNGLRLMAVIYAAAYAFGTLANRIRAQQKQLQQENDRMMLLLGTLPEGVFLLGRDGSVILANPAGRKLQVETAGLDMSERLARFRGPLEEFESKNHDRILNHVLACGSPEGPIVWVIRDLTEQRRLMARLMHQSKMTDLGLLAAGIAHEIGNPLSSMSALIQLIQTKPNPPETSEKLGVLRALTERLSGTLRQIRSFAEPSPDRRVPTSPASLLDKALQVFRLHDKSREIQIDVAAGSKDDPTVAVQVVEDQMVQVLLNLLLNAADASNGSGKIEVRTEARDSEVRISVTDHGVGISEEARHHLFSPFYTTKDPGKGSGLGLFISESIVRAHGGNIQVRSAPGEGSTFTVGLPQHALGGH